MAIPEDFKEMLLERVDLYQIVSEVVKLKKQGGEYVGLCPFHTEKSPSFSVSPTKNKYHCFGCGAGGDAIAFMREIHGMTFRDAVFHFAGNLGLKVPEEDNRTPQQKAEGTAQQREAAKIRALNKQVAEIYSSELKKNPVGQRYLRSRQITQEAVEHFALGYAPSGWRYLKDFVRDYESSDMMRADLVVAKEVHESNDQEKVHVSSETSLVVYDRFRARLIFPILSFSGEVIGFGGRTVDDATPKYLNTAETPAFHKGRELYGLFQARKEIAQAKSAIVVEGYMDVVSMWIHGVKNAVASLGTACTQDQLMKLLRYTSQVTFCFDGDSAGRRAAVKAMQNVLPFVEGGKMIRFALLPEKEDPDTFLQKHGKEAFLDLLSKATPLSEFMVKEAMSGNDLNIPEGRANAINRGYELWSELPAGSFKSLMVGEFAKMGFVDQAGLMREWQEKANEKQKGEAKKEAMRALEVEARPDSGAKVVLRRPDEHPPGTPLAAARSKNFQRKAVYEAGVKAPKSLLERPAGAELKSLSGFNLNPDQMVIVGMALHLEHFSALSATEVALLCEAGGDLARFITWVEGVFYESGALAWPDLREKLTGHELEQPILKMIVAFQNNVLMSKSMSKETFAGYLKKVKIQVISKKIESIIEAKPEGYEDLLRAQYAALSELKKREAGVTA